MDEKTRTLVARAQAGDRPAMDELFARHAGRLRAALQRRLGDQYRGSLLDSEDAAQDAMLAALRRFQDFEYRGSGSFLAWLLKGAEFEVRHRLREQAARKRGGRRSARERGDLPEEARREPMARGESPSQAAAAHELEDRVMDCLRKLPAQQRDVLMLRRYFGLSTDAIRVEMGMQTAGAVRALLSRAQAGLAGLLDQGGT
jgi:RNA polymerase sigma-70 factor (ECF subfamily)